MKKYILEQRLKSHFFFEAIAYVASLEQDKVTRLELYEYGRAKRAKILEERRAGDLKTMNGKKWRNLKKAKFGSAKDDIEVMQELGLLVEVEAGSYSINRDFSLQEAVARTMK